jgi:hypothetical protein
LSAALAELNAVIAALEAMRQRAGPKPTLTKLSEDIAALKASLAKPKTVRIIRGPDGKAIGAQHL